MLDDTIIAISTPLGTGGLGIVRLSGKEALSIVRRLFKPAREKQTIPPRRPVLGWIFDDHDGQVFEQAVLTYFPAPRSYTTEDMIELSMHGSPVILEEALRLGIRSGARHADRGEFTLRAFLGGRLDLIQAQAVNDIIRAPSLHQARISFRQIEGGLSRRLNSLRGRLVRLLSDVEVGIEFPEEGTGIPRSRILRTLERTRKLVESLVRSYDIGKSLAEGITLAVSGRPNVGKSTLFNALLEMDRAIVTPEPGTTRDYLMETCRIGDSVFSLIDTAGLDSPSNRAEREGIRRSKKLTGAADGALLVFDASRRETAEDIRTLHRRRGLPTLLVFNKSDLPRKIDRDQLIRESDGSPAQDVSALHGIGLDALREQITTTFIRTRDPGRDVILHLRQKLLLEEIEKGLDAGIRTMADGQPDEMLAEDLRAALEPAGRLLGEILPDEILNRIFRQFCIGK